MARTFTLLDSEYSTIVNLDTLKNSGPTEVIRKEGDVFIQTDLTSIVPGGFIWQRTGTNISPITSGDSLKINTINEETTDSGVTIEGVLIKDTSITISTLTAGSVLFAGTGGLISQDNSNLFWDNTNKRLGFGIITPADAIHIVNTLGSNIILNTNTGSVSTGIYMTEGSSGTSKNNGAYVYYNGSTNTFNIATGSGSPTDKLTIERDTGNVGIGTSSPLRQLTLGGATQARLLLTTTSTGGTIADGFEIQVDTDNSTLLWNYENASIKFATNNAERMSITSTGNVGIGTTSPVGKLEINASSIYHLTLNNTLGTENKRIFGFAVGDSSQNLNINALNDSHSWVRGLMTIQHDGNVGIGTSSPTQKFEINGGATHGFPLTSGTTQTYGRFRLENNEASNAVLDIGIYGTNGAWIQATLKTDLSTNYPLLLNPNGGDVGIGTSSPTLGKLQIVQSVDTSSGGITVLDSTSTRNIRIYTTTSAGYIEGNSGGTTNLVLNSGGGNVGIGATPSYKLHIIDTTDQTIGQYINKTSSNSAINPTGLNTSVGLTHTSGTRSSALATYTSFNISGNGGTTTNAYCFDADVTIGTGATVTNLYGLYIGAPTNSGTITSHYGLFVASQTSANNNYGLYLQNSQYNTMTCLARDGVLYLNEGSATASQHYAISFLRTHSDTGANVATINTEMLGAIHWRGNSGTGVTYGAGIYAQQIGSAGTTTPTALYFQTADGTNAMATRLYILPTGESLFGTGTTSIAVGGIAGKIQVQGTDAGKSSITTTRYSNDASPAYIAFGKSRGATVGTYTIVQDNDILGRIDFNASDGTDINSRGASIFARINGTPGSNDVPTELVFCTTADGASDVTEHMAIDSTGAVTIYGFTPSLTFTDINTSADSVIDCSSNAGSMFISADQNNESANTVMAFKVDGTERGRFTSNGNFLVGSTDDDGTPTTARFVAQGSTNDGSTNDLVLRDSDGVNVFTVDTDGVLKAGISGTNYFEIEAGGFPHLNGTVAYNDLQFSIESGKVGAANQPNWEALTTNIYAYSFDVDDYIDLGANEIPHWWKEGTNGDIHLHLAIKSTNATGANRFAKFTVYVAYADTTEVWTETSFTAEYTIPNGTVALTHKYLDIGDFVLTNQLIGCQVKIRVKRIAATGGTEYADSVFITQCGVHLQQDTLGSRTEATK